MRIAVADVAGQTIVTDVVFQAIEDSFGMKTPGRFELVLGVDRQGLKVAKCDSGPDSCGVDGGAIYLLDPWDMHKSGNEISDETWPDDVRDELRAKALNDFCGTGGSAQCSFIPPNGRDTFSRSDFTSTMSNPETLMPTIENRVRADDPLNSDPATPITGRIISVSRTVTKSITISHGLAHDEEFSIELDANVYDIVSLGVSNSTSSSLQIQWSNAFDKSTFVSKDIHYGEALVSTYRVPVYRVRGDFIIKIGTTTYHLHDIPFDLPRSDADSEIQQILTTVKIDL
jgi:hypothetical protein